MSELSSDSETTFISQQAKSVADEFEIGQVVGGKYKIVSLLGRGGIGSVYKVEQFLLQQNFALKTLNSQKASDQLIRRFQNEARAASSLSHPNLVKVIDFGLLEGQQPYLVMDLVEGVSLSEYLKKHGSLTVDEAVSCFSQICLGLSYAHDQGIVHRDIKPGNIMISSILSFGAEGFVRVVDFGIAKLAYAEGGEVQALTTTGEIFGSPLYMSPEQCSGTAVDHRSDIYSLGCVLFEALTGTTPFVGQNALTTMMLHQSERSPSLKEASLGKDFPPELEQIVAKMLAKSPADRYHKLGIVANDLAQLMKGAPVLGIADGQKKPTGKVDKPLTMSRREMQMWLCVTALSAGLLGAGIGNFAASLRFSPNAKESSSKGIDAVESALSKSGNRGMKAPVAITEQTSDHSREGAADKVSRDTYKIPADLNSNALEPYEDDVVIDLVSQQVGSLKKGQLQELFQKITKTLDKSKPEETSKYRDCLDKLLAIRKHATTDSSFVDSSMTSLEVHIAICYMRLGNLKEGEKHLKQAATTSGRPLERNLLAHGYQELAQHLVRANEAHNAFRAYRYAAGVYDGIYKQNAGNPDFISAAAFSVGECYRACCDLALNKLKDNNTAIDMGRRAVDAAERTKGKRNLAYNLIYLGIAYSRDNQIANARPLLIKGENTIPRLNQTNEDITMLCFARSELAAVESRGGDNKAASVWAGKAIEALAQYQPVPGGEKALEIFRKQTLDQKKIYDRLSASE